MISLDGQSYAGIREPGGTQVTGVSLCRCSFVGCALAVRPDPARRTVVRDVQIARCDQRGCSIGPAILDTVDVERLTSHTLLQMWGTVFRHVRLRGPVGRIMASSRVAAGGGPSSTQRAFDIANAHFYDGVDWALDITEAELVDADLRGVPGSLVRRDPETQFLIRRDAAVAGAWRSLDLSRTHWPVALEWLVKSGQEDLVLVAPKRSRDFKTLLEGLQALRQAGIADPT